MRTATLDGWELYYWVAKSEGLSEQLIDRPATWERSRVQGRYASIIKRENIRICAGHKEFSAVLFGLSAERSRRCYTGYSINPLTAGMRAFVASRYGDEVPEIPCTARQFPSARESGNRVSHHQEYAPAL